MTLTRDPPAIRVDDLTKAYRFGGTRQVVLDKATFM